MGLQEVLVVDVEEVAAGLVEDDRLKVASKGYISSDAIPLAEPTSHHQPHRVVLDGTRNGMKEPLQVRVGDVDGVGVAGGV